MCWGREGVIWIYSISMFMYMLNEARAGTGTRVPICIPGKKVNRHPRCDVDAQKKGAKHDRRLGQLIIRHALAEKFDSPKRLFTLKLVSVREQMKHCYDVFNLD